MKEGRDGAHLIASVKPFQTLGPEYEMHFWPIDLLHFGRANSEEVAVVREVCLNKGVGGGMVRQ